MGACTEPISGGGNPDCNLKAFITDLNPGSAGRLVASQDFVGAPGQKLSYQWDGLDLNDQKSYFSSGLKFAYSFLSGTLSGFGFPIETYIKIGTFDSLFRAGPVNLHRSTSGFSA